MTTVTSHEAEMVALALPPIAAVLALVATCVAACRTPRSFGNGWAWMGLALLSCWAPLPPGSLLTATSALLTVAAVVLIGDKTVRMRLCDAFDSFILALGLVAIWSTLHAGRLLPVPADVSVSASLCQVGCIALLAVAGLTALRDRSRPLVLLAVAAALLAVGDLPHVAYAAAQGLPVEGRLAAASAATSALGYLVLSWSALAARSRAAPQHAAPAQAVADPLVGITQRSHHLYALPYLPLAAAIGTAIVQHSLGASPTSTTVSLLLAATALTLARQYLTLRDNRQLADAVLAGRSDLHRQSRQDPVTGLANRVVFTSTLAHAMARQGDNGRSLAVVVCDVDGFRSLNDALGQAVGDRLLAEVATRITETVGMVGVGCTGSVCTVARLGDDEFAVLLDDLHAADGACRAMTLAATLHDRLATTSVIDGVQVSLGVAVGVAVVHAHQPQARADEVLGKADVALHLAKRTVRRRPVLHHDGMSLPDERDWLLRPAFDQALRSGAVIPHFQPLVELDSGRIRAFEALARWPQGGQATGPDVFVPVAARAGLLPELATLMLRSATVQLLAWRARPDLSHLQVAVNVAPNQIADPTFPALVDRVLDEVGLPASGLVLEITEESLLDDQDGAARVISALRRLGVTVWLDDFGAGYSSLALLHRLPLQGIKLDKTLVCDIEVEPHLRRLVAGLVSLGGDLGLEVIAEGIQHWAQERTLRHLGCTLGQGFLFAPAATGAECEPLLRRPVLYSGVPRLVG